MCWLGRSRRWVVQRLAVSSLASANIMCGGGAANTAPPGAPSTQAESPARPRPERKLNERIAADNLRAELTPYIESVGKGFGVGYQMSGFVAVSGAGQVLYEHAFGHADHEAKTPNSADTVFRIGAITKQFTAAAILGLAAREELSLDARVNKYLPDYPSVGASITLHQLLSHTSGLSNYLNTPALRESSKPPHDARALLEQFWSLPLEFEPGSDFRYGDSGYAVLGAVIEQVSGRSYPEYMQREVFDRFGLTHTRAGELPAAPTAARGYSAAGDGGLQLAKGVDAALLSAGGMVCSSARDLLAWHDALQMSEVISGELEASFYRPVRSHYAYGWIVTERHGVSVLQHGGNLDGFASYFARVPELDLALVVLSNNSSIDAVPIFEAALAAALGEKLAPLEAGKGVAIDPSILPRITGTYRLSEESAEQLKQHAIPKKTLQAMLSVRIYDEKGTLYFKPVGQSAVPLIALGPGWFVLLGGKAKIEVTLDPDGTPATRLTLEQGPVRAVFTRRARVHGKPDKSEPEGEPPL